MAAEHRPELLSYLLGMAYMEVCAQLGKAGGAVAQRPERTSEMSTRN